MPRSRSAVPYAPHLYELAVLDDGDRRGGNVALLDYSLVEIIERIGADRDDQQRQEWNAQAGGFHAAMMPQHLAASRYGIRLIPINA
jgi:hypothetical protein